MRIQGWELHAASAKGNVCRLESGYRSKKSETQSPFDADSPRYQPDPSRKKLLDSIKRRIEAGFYNSETVIDDLGHGFAQALDQTL
ncbi:MAG: hypothetical protein JXA18_04990 [Chitinispirillaceae bacterium]|nr:hypothetical protein [Chitinispirillaceae bacterium]